MSDEENESQIKDTRQGEEEKRGEAPVVEERKLSVVSGHVLLGAPRDMPEPDKSMLGQGGKGDVTLAILKRNASGPEEVVAVKQLRPDSETDMEKFSKAFAHEVDLLADLSHPNVVQMIGFVEDLENDKAWVIFPWEANGNVREFLASGEWEIPE
ncbi:hypothetical protein FRC00_003718, partial [Tulasnella sp. 408]